MPYTGPKYATEVNFVNYCRTNKLLATDAVTQPWYAIALKAASQEIDRVTGRWWDQRAARFTTQGIVESKSLYLPQRIISITSITEAGIEIYQGVTPQVVYIWDSWVEKLGLYMWPNERAALWGAYWSPKPQDVVVTGTFGEPEWTGGTANEEIQMLCCAIAAAQLDLRRRDFISANGDIGSSPIGKYPEWIKDKLENYRFKHVEPTRALLAYT